MAEVKFKIWGRSSNDCLIRWSECGNFKIYNLEDGRYSVQQLSKEAYGYQTIARKAIRLSLKDSVALANDWAKEGSEWVDWPTEDGYWWLSPLYQSAARKKSNDIVHKYADVAAKAAGKTVPPHFDQELAWFKDGKLYRYASPQVYTEPYQLGYPRKFKRAVVE